MAAWFSQSMHCMVCAIGRCATTGFVLSVPPCCPSDGCGSLATVARQHVTAVLCPGRLMALGCSGHRHVSTPLVCAVPCMLHGCSQPCLPLACWQLHGHSKLCKPAPTYTAWLGSQQCLLGGEVPFVMLLQQPGHETGSEQRTCLTCWPGGHCCHIRVAWLSAVRICAGCLL
jgi:hypothetical protein